MRSFAEAYNSRRTQALRQRARLPDLEERLAQGDPSVTQEEIRDVRNDREWIEYLLTILPFLKAYTREEGYDSVSPATAELTSTPTPATTTVVDESLSTTTTTTAAAEDPTTTTTNARGSSSGGAIDIVSTQVVDVERVTYRGTVFAEYLRTVERVQSVGPSDRPVLHTDLLAQCRECGHENLVIIDRDATRVCAECGCVEEGYQREESNLFSFREESEQMSRNVQFAYKRANHFLDWLNAFESGSGHCSGSVPECVVDTIRYELKKLRIVDIATITPDLVRQLLKKTQLTKYYEYTNAITAEIGGHRPLRLVPEIKHKLCVMFGLLQRPFDLYKPASRKNFLSYSYVIFKCLQLLGEDHLLQYFSLLKSREKLKMQDAIWKKICQHLMWQYIPCV